MAACSTSPVRSAQLEQAKLQYERASRDAELVRRASVELDLARDALEMAETQRLSGANSKIGHYVYLFDQHMRMATLAIEQHNLDEQLSGKPARAGTMEAKQGVKKIDNEVNWDLLLAAAHAAAPDADSDIDSNADSNADSDINALMNKNTSPDQSMSDDFMTVGDVLFNVNRATIAAGSERIIDKLVLFLNQNSDRMAVIEGHTDNTGDKEYNQSLSRDRAFAVQQALVKEGISANRLAVRGMGDSDPVESNETESGRRLNRRVDVVLLD